MADITQLGGVLSAADGAADDGFGVSSSVSGNGNVLVVGANLWEGAASNQGGAYVFDRSGNTWVQRGSVLEAADAGADDSYAHAVALNSDGTVLAVGAYTWDGTYTDQGCVYIYDWTGSAWVQRGSVLLSPSQSASQYFGLSVSLNSSGTVLAVGAYGYTSSFSNQGGVYIFDWTGSAWAVRGSIITATDANAFDGFGVSCSLNSNATVLAVGAHRWEPGAGTSDEKGGVYILDWSGSAWSSRGAVLEAPDAGNDDLFGRSVALNGVGNMLAVGAIGWDSGAGNQGGVYIFNWTGSVWAHDAPVLVASDAANDDNFGESLSFSADGSVLVVGGSLWEGAASNQGGVYTYSLLDLGNLAPNTGKFNTTLSGGASGILPNTGEFSSSLLAGVSGLRDGRGHFLSELSAGVVGLNVPNCGFTSTLHGVGEIVASGALRTDIPVGAFRTLFHGDSEIRLPDALDSGVGGFNSTLSAYGSGELSKSITAIGKFNSTLQGVGIANEIGTLHNAGNFKSTLNVTSTSHAVGYLAGNKGAFKSALVGRAGNALGIGINSGSFVSTLAAYGAAIDTGKLALKQTPFASHLLGVGAFNDYAVLKQGTGAFNSTLSKASRLNIASAGFHSSLHGIGVTVQELENGLNLDGAFVMNMATNQVSRYSNFPFMDIIQVDGNYYGVRTNGLYLLGGKVDSLGTTALDTDPKVNGRIRTKDTDFGVMYSTSMPYVYVGSDDHSLTVSPVVNGCENYPEYPAGFCGRRVKMGRGIKGRYWSLKISHIENMHALEMVPEALGRKVK